ncbi:MAG: hypothetical protein J6Y23_04275, partial [Prevotella sp.]|nr:hypothetical protein [Prevotella sp.]
HADETTAHSSVIIINRSFCFIGFMLLVVFDSIGVAVERHGSGMSTIQGKFTKISQIMDKKSHFFLILSHFSPTSPTSPTTKRGANFAPLSL